MRTFVLLVFIGLTIEVIGSYSMKTVTSTNTNENDDEVAIVMSDKPTINAEIIDIAKQNTTRIITPMRFNILGMFREFFRRLKSIFSFLLHPTLDPIDEIEGRTNDTLDLKEKPLQWTGKVVTDQEWLHVLDLRRRLTEDKSIKSSWSEKATNIELLRFLRSKNGNVNDAWKSIVSHMKWRDSKFGADSKFTNTMFENSPLHKEIFWMGKDKNDCPTLVIRSQVHDGLYYNEDPHIFVSFMVSILEQGKELYGVGTQTPMCVLIDRGGTVFRNGKKKIEKRDMSVIPNLMELFRNLYSTIMENYPDLIISTRIAPTSWFFVMCYKITSRVLDAKSREVFQLIKPDEVKKKIHPFYDLKLLPEHLGGSSDKYTSTTDVFFNPNDSPFPIDAKKFQKMKKEMENS